MGEVTRVDSEWPAAKGQCSRCSALRAVTAASLRGLSAFPARHSGTMQDNIYTCTAVDCPKTCSFVLQNYVVLIVVQSNDV